MQVWSRAPLSFLLRVHRRWLPALQKRLLQSAVLQSWRILSQIEASVRSEDHVEVMGLNAAGATLKSVFSDGSLTEALAVWLTHRLLWALPWAARHVPPSAVAARALGQIFDSTASVLSRHAVRPMADAWPGVGWSVKWTRRFGEEWALQLPTGKAASAKVQAQFKSTTSKIHARLQVQLEVLRLRVHWQMPRPGAGPAARGLRLGTVSSAGVALACSLALAAQEPLPVSW
jgi:hypothetical protein